ncbi:hypothetical protein HDV03_000165 [Kappamyces sp. JEL0829]|nr:hypothetical protein HDV03_000165 [Kappamyces sp. JEL0829]
MQKDIHSIPGSIQNELSVGNILWALLFGWWISLVYVAVATTILAPVYLLGVLMLCGTSTVAEDRRADLGTAAGLYVDIALELKALKGYILVLLNLAGYIFWPFGKFIAKKHVPKARSRPEPSDDFALPNAAMPLLSSHEHDLYIGMPTEEDEPAHPAEERDPLPSRSHTSRDDEWDAWSEHSAANVRLPKSANKLWNLVSRAWYGAGALTTRKSGFSGMFFFTMTSLVLGPVHLIVMAIMFFLVVPLPMAKLNYYLIRHLLRHPLQLSAHWCEEDVLSHASAPEAASNPGPSGSQRSLQRSGLRPINPSSGRPKSIFFWRSDSALFDENPLDTIPVIMATPSIRPAPNVVFLHQHQKQYQIVLCTYRAMGWEYTRYTVDGINIIFINLLAAIVFTLADYYIFQFTSKPIIFLGGILSTVPLSYFIGMAVSSITAQTGSVAVGSVVNATFGSIIEIILYAFGLMEGKEELVQGAMIGSFLLGLLALPGVSMFFGGLKRLEQRFNAKSASVTSTMLVVAVICVFTPTIFQNIHGTYHFECKDCPGNKIDLYSGHESCRDCKMYQPHPTDDPIYLSATRPIMYVCAAVLVLTYATGLWFTLRTHSHRIYGKKKPKKGTKRRAEIVSPAAGFSPASCSSAVPAQTSSGARRKPEMPTSPLANSFGPSHPSHKQDIRQRRLDKSPVARPVSAFVDDSSSSSEDENLDGGHDNPGWSIFKSAAILLGCTIAYSLIAEILIDSIDEIIEAFPISEKILGLTLFAIVPTVTEFYNAISFAMSGNIVLSLEIGSAYAIQVALLQIPVMVAFSALWNSPLLERFHRRISHHAIEVSEFTLVFPQWEFYCLAFSTFLLTYVYLEGKSNYFKGALLLLTYVVLITAFFFEPVSRF